MKRLGRILLNAATILSLMLLTATVALWVRSYAHLDVVQILLDEHRSISFASGTGCASFGREDEGFNRETWYFTEPISQEFRRFWTLEWSRSQRSWGKRWTFGFPYLVLLFSVLPLINLPRRRHRAPGLCSHCGYDLRATPAPCPECGTAPAGAHAEAPTTLPPT